MTDEEIVIIEERIKLAFTVAMNLRHSSAGRVEIHMAQNVFDYLKARHEAVLPSMYAGPPTMWGFPLVIQGVDDHLSVHAVEVIE